jgi:nitroimidazol reductase NimA-like FMN-containing flavoprotein (pyridoxamine 5'-phosphate oxidase superfamily)
MTDSLAELSYDECLDLLRTYVVGRIGLVVNDFPVIFPVNYRLAETSGPDWLAVRTRPGGVLDHPSLKVAFEVDGIDVSEQRGWSVLVRGTLHHVDPDAASFRERFDPKPWITEERDAWLVIDPFSITGRRLESAASEFAYNPAAYL